MSDNLYAFNVRLATVEDAPAIKKITHDAFIRYCDAANLEYTIDAVTESVEDIESDIKNKYVFIVKIDHELIGAVRVKINEDGTAYLSRFAIDEAHGNAGIGKILMRVVDKVMLENKVKTLKLHTSSKVTALIRFYYGRGFYISSVDYQRGYPRAELVKEYQVQE